MKHEGDKPSVPTKEFVRKSAIHERVSTMGICRRGEKRGQQRTRGRKEEREEDELLSTRSSESKLELLQALPTAWKDQSPRA